MWGSTPSTQTLLCIEMAGATGLEPAISYVIGRRSNQLNYAPQMNGQRTAEKRFAVSRQEIKHEMGVYEDLSLELKGS
jgi:hypothetical protein